MFDWQQHRSSIIRARARAMSRGDRRSWFEIRAQAGNAEVTEILIYDEIGFWGVQASDFVRELQMVTSPKILVRLNSPGGDIFDGLAIYNALGAHPAQVQTHVDGLAASVASVIMLAGETITAADASFVMIHNPWSLVIGDAAEMRQMADILDKIGGQIAGLYSDATGQSEAAVAAWMAGETWFTAEEALGQGLLDEIRSEPLVVPAPDEPDAPGIEPDDPDEPLPAYASKLAGFDLSIFRNAPRALRHASGARPGAGAKRERPEGRQNGPGGPQDGAGTGGGAGARDLASRRRRLRAARLAAILKGMAR